jgi:hypothetical protein
VSNKLDYKYPTIYLNHNNSINNKRGSYRTFKSTLYKYSYFLHNKYSTNTKIINKNTPNNHQQQYSNTKTVFTKPFTITPSLFLDNKLTLKKLLRNKKILPNLHPITIINYKSRKSSLIKTFYSSNIKYLVNNKASKKISKIIPIKVPNINKTTYSKKIYLPYSHENSIKNQYHLVDLLLSHKPLLNTILILSKPQSITYLNTFLYNKY